MSLGVIGGLGPMATAYFLELIIDMTKAERDQEHLEMIIYNCPTIPDRTAYILGKSEESPLPKIIELGKRLKEQQVTCIAIPCITAHYFHQEIEAAVETRVIHGIRETALLLKEADIQRVGIMATDGTVESGIFQRELEALGITPILPKPDMQKKVMSLIYEDIKKGKEPDLDSFFSVKDYLTKQEGAQAIVLGCTELSVIKRDYDLGEGVLDAMEVLVKKALSLCGKELNPKYNKLFVPYSLDK